MCSVCRVRSVGLFFFFKQKTAYEMRISDWSSDVCSSDLGAPVCGIQGAFYNRKTSEEFGAEIVAFKGTAEALTALKQNRCVAFVYDDAFIVSRLAEAEWKDWKMPLPRSEEHTCELQSLMRTPYAVLSLQKNSYEVDEQIM